MAHGRVRRFKSFRGRVPPESGCRDSASPRGDRLPKSSDRDALLVADDDERADALAKRDLEAARLLDLLEVERAQLLLDAAAVVGDERVRDAEARGGFELRDVRRAEVAVPEHAEHP